MGSSDSTCCSSSTRKVKSDTDTTILKRNRKSYQLKRQQSTESDPFCSAAMGYEGELAPDSPGTDKLITTLKLYHQHSMDLNNNYMKQYEVLMQCFMNQIAKNNINIDQKDMEDIYDTIKLPMHSGDNIKENIKDDIKEDIKENIEKRKYGDVSTQIEILHSEGSRAQSLLLCIKTQKIENEDISLDNFGFMRFLSENLSEQIALEVFNKFPKSQLLSTSQFVSLLTLIVILYKMQLYQLQTGDDKPQIDTQKIKASIEHLAIWCIRRYGVKQKNKMKIIKVSDDLGQIISGKYYSYKLKFNRNNYTKNLYHWIQEYVDNDGAF